ncbi:hypothetical protein G7046_g8027 [Stylonectria norvegica]|nr:hypothetical protein G7046_g8027 [Stylonectria norvegica]
MAPLVGKEWKVTRTDIGFDGLELLDTQIPALRDHEVLGTYPFHLTLPVVPGSDGAGEIVDVGAKVTLWKPNDRVITLLSQSHLYGPSTPATPKLGLGGGIDGVLRQYGILDEQGLVRAPQNLTYLEASTLPCAGVTSWNALYGLRPLRAGQWVLVLGTGGVSLFALQFAKAAGATVIATTSSDEKAKKLRQLGADHVVNYKHDTEWGQTVRNLSPHGHGVDHVIEVGGAGTLGQSRKAVKMEGIISVVGAVSQEIGQPLPSILDCWIDNFIARGVWAGSRVMMEEMVASVESNNIHPVLDGKTFSLQDAREAFGYFASGANLGKVVIATD